MTLEPKVPIFPTLNKCLKLKTALLTFEIIKCSNN